MEFHSFPSEKVETSFILKILNDLKVDINQVTKIAVTGGKSSDLENSVNSWPSASNFERTFFSQRR